MPLEVPSQRPVNPLSTGDPEEPTGACLVCGAATHEDVYCVRCRARYPMALLKAHQDKKWDYFMRLRDGLKIRFNGCTIMGDTVHVIILPQQWREFLAKQIGLDFIPERGIDVRTTDIIWCLDCATERPPVTIGNIMRG